MSSTSTPSSLTDQQLPPQFIPPNFDTMPAELTQRPKWVLWVPVWTGSKWTKRPVQPSGYGASSTNSRHWSSFEEVRTAYECAVAEGGIVVHQKEGSQLVPIGGVGFVFDGVPDQDGLVLAGVDFDRVMSADARIVPLAQERITRLGSYCEASVSGRGLHVIVKARPLAGGIAHGGVELYTSGRYFTMTGQTFPWSGPVAAAVEEFAALAEELRSTRQRPAGNAALLTVVGGRDLGSALPMGVGSQCGADANKSELAAGIDTDNWFNRLSTEERCEAVRHAAFHLAHHSRLFQLGEHGGKYQEYLKLAFAIGRSGVPDAEEIFVQVASTAIDADPEDKLRDFFQNCNTAPPHVNGITVGTLFHLAQEHGADFSTWKLIADARAARAGAASPGGEGPADLTTTSVIFAPGNEEACRKELDSIVAADARTFTLGDPAGPLVILRVPDEQAVAPDVKWEGDLPGTTLAVPADIMQRAERIAWMQRAGGKGGQRLSRTRPPRDFVADYITQMRGQYGARPLRGIARVPGIDDRGEVNFVAGYDSQTGLYHDKVPAFDIPTAPTRDDALRAAAALFLPFSKYSFEDPVAGHALVLGAVFTALERPFLSNAPMLVIRSSMPGTGKGLFVRTLVRLAFDTFPIVATWGGSGEEFEKRLAALLLQAPAAICIDNANGMLVEGDLLESVITEGRADIRPLGRSEMVRVRNRSLIMLTGNNPIITGDMARRALVLEISPRSADPERDRYEFNPTDMVGRRRTDFLRAGLIVMKAFRLAGMPRRELPGVGSFDDWTRRVRDLVDWLTGYDLSEAFRRNKAEDPKLQGDASLLAALHSHFGITAFRGAEAIAVHEKVTSYQRTPHSQPKPTGTELALHDTLDSVLGSRGVNAKLLGYWARRVKGAHIGGYILDTRHEVTTNVNLITVRGT